MSSSAGLSQVEVSFRSGNDQLAGTLTLPAGDGPHPALVFVHGSGSTNREGMGRYPAMFQEFAGRGVASLSWDKPGVGESTGDFRKQTFDDRAAEVAASITFLKRRDDIDPNRIGMWGISQAGWVMPLACGLVPDIAYVIAVSVPVSTVEKQNLYRIEQTFPADGYSRQETAQAFALMDRLQKLVLSDAPMEELVELVERYEGERWVEVAIGVPKEVWAYRETKPFLTFDPKPHISKISCPVLAIFGEKDRIVDVPESVEGYRRLLAEAGNDDLTVKVFPGANHSIVLAETGGQEEMQAKVESGDIEFAPGYLALMGSWLEERVGRH